MLLNETTSKKKCWNHALNLLMSQKLFGLVWFHISKRQLVLKSILRKRSKFKFTTRGWKGFGPTRRFDTCFVHHKFRRHSPLNRKLHFIFLLLLDKTFLKWTYLDSDIRLLGFRILGIHVSWIAYFSAFLRQRRSQHTFSLSFKIKKRFGHSDWVNPTNSFFYRRVKLKIRTSRPQIWKTASVGSRGNLGATGSKMLKNFFVLC